MESYKHFLITRFNIVQNWYFNCAKQGRNATIQTDEWLHTRINLFEKFCLPSLIQQTNQNFTWLVLFNSESPQYLKEKIKKWEKQYSIFYPLYLVPNGDENQIVRNTIKELRREEKWIITSRLDNDDMISYDYMKEMQQHAKAIIESAKYKDFFVNAPNGYLYDTENRILRNWDNYYSSHFITRCTKYASNEELKTVLCDHSDVSQFAHYEELLTTKRLWVEVVHNCNVANHIVLFRPNYFRENTFPTEFIQEVNTAKYKLWVFFANIGRWCENIIESCLRLSQRIVKKIFRMLGFKQ